MTTAVEIEIDALKAKIERLEQERDVTSSEAMKISLDGRICSATNLLVSYLAQQGNFFDSFPCCPLIFSQLIRPPILLQTLHFDPISTSDAIRHSPCLQTEQVGFPPFSLASACVSGPCEDDSVRVLSVSRFFPFVFLPFPWHCYGISLSDAIRHSPYLQTKQVGIGLNSLS